MSTSEILARSLALGLAAGARSTLGPCAPLWAREERTSRRGLLALTIAGELAADKAPGIPPRTAAPVLLSRVLGGAWGGALLARNLGGPVVLSAAVVAAVAAPVGAVVGVRWRSWWSESRPSWEGAVIEDAIALTLACYAVSGTPRRS